MKQKKFTSNLVLNKHVISQFSYRSIKGKGTNVATCPDSYYICEPRPSELNTCDSDCASTQPVGCHGF